MSDWEPNNQQGAVPLGFMTPDGTYVGPDRPRPFTNRLHRSDDPIARRIAEFCDAAPPEIPTAVASFGGVLLGLRLAQRYPELIDRLVSSVLDASKDPMTLAGDNPLDDTVDLIVRGRDY